jgi:SAM-dependent methyltransferase
MPVRHARATLVEGAFALMAAGIAGNALRLRGRVRRLAVLDDDAGTMPSTGPPCSPGAAAVDGPTPAAASRFTVVTGDGVTLTDATVAAAVRHADAHGLDVVDLVPGDLPSARLIELATHVDPGSYRADKLAIGWGAGHAAVARTSVLERVAGCDGSEEAAHPGVGQAGRTVGHTGLDPVAYLRLARQLKRHAPTTTDLAVAPGLATVEPHVSWRTSYLRVLLGVAMPVLAPGPALGAALVAVAPMLARRGGGAALAAYLAEPYLVAAGGPVHPLDLARDGRPRASVGSRAGRPGGRWRRRGSAAAAVLARPVREAATVVRSVVDTPTPAVEAHIESQAAAERASRRAYARAVAGSDAFFEQPRSTCPWCRSTDIVELHTMPDLIQGKPGTFRLDECRACTHVFQNPRLTLAGLDHYYRDFYDGLQAEHTELLFSFTGASYLCRAKMLEHVVGAAGPPKRWLDVGTGHGHFCLVASDIWPETRFDGLDMTASIDEAQRRGWVERGYRGLFPDLADDLAGGYDVVSMHHYLEHTRAPGRELDAARTVLEEGGHLLVELPAPESGFGRRLGWAWGPWFQPQHQHLIPLANLAAALRARDFTVVAVERHEAHQAVDLTFAVMLLAMRLAPAGSAPWDPPPRRLRQAARAAVFTGLLPLAGAAMVADQVLRPVIRARPDWSNTYRLLARRD